MIRLPPSIERAEALARRFEREARANVSPLGVAFAVALAALPLFAALALALVH